jgi:integrase
MEKMSLTALEVKRATCPPNQKISKKSDGNGLFLLTKSNGSKLWRFRFRFTGSYQELALGQYPTIPLVEARNLAAQARTLLVQGINPAEERRIRKHKSNAKARSFKEVALAWWQLQRTSWSDEHAKKVKVWIEADMKHIARLSIGEVDQGHIVELMQSIELEGHRRKAPVILAVISRIFGYALAHRYTRMNPAQGLPLNDILKPMPRIQHRAAITKPLPLGQLIRDIDNTDSGAFCTVEALKLIPRLFLRPKEIRCLKWANIDFTQKLLIIPAEDMKRGREHLVPLANQVVKQLLAVQEVTGYSPYVFPGQRSSDKPISKNVMTTRLRDLGYSADVMSAHGFRSTASTMLHEQGWEHDVIETQLAHLTGTSTSRSYNRAMHLGERTRMMQSWADHLDALRDGADVVAIGGRRHA